MQRLKHLDDASLVVVTSKDAGLNELFVTFDGGCCLGLAALGS
jgi:hypothetical protein